MKIRHGNFLSATKKKKYLCEVKLVIVPHLLQCLSQRSNLTAENSLSSEYTGLRISK